MEIHIREVFAIDNYCIALIPAYKPGKSLIALLDSLCEAGFIPVVVDDGSGESFTDLFNQAAQYADVLTHHENQGKGRALKTGLAYIQKMFGKNDTVVTLDADGQHCLEDAVRVCETSLQHPDALIIGSRSFKREMPLRSKFGNMITKIAFHLSTGVKLNDTQTGLRAFHARMIPKLLDISGERYEYEMNVLLELASNRVPIREVPIQAIYIDNNSSSHFHAIKDSWRIYRGILKFSASSFIGFLVDYLLYSLLLMRTGNLHLSNICARIVSATINYSLNRKLVFRSSVSAIKSALQYTCLATVILAGNTAVLTLLVDWCGVDQMLAKILVEILLFVLSWTVQRCIIFRDGGQTR